MSKQRSRSFWQFLILCAFGLLFMTFGVLAQQNGGGSPSAKPADKRRFNPHDLSGIWLGDKYGFNANFVPPMTPEGKNKFEANRPSYGLAKGSPAALEQVNVPLGRRRAVPPALGNDPAGTCNPLGLIRLLLYESAPLEIVQTPDRILEFFEWTWDRREIWTDGRAQANVQAYLPRFNGYSTGKWEGDTFVATTVGFDDRQWIDHFGYPLSSEAKLEERYRRISFSAMELSMTLTDPKTYTQPWISDVQNFRYITKEETATGTNWAGLAENKCVPLDEVDNFNKNIRDPAGGIKK